MNREGHNNVKFFVGPEVEHTPAYSKKTLFVVGKQDVQEIVKHARTSGAPHVFMGANHSFVADSNDKYWDKTITELLDRGFWVTLDYQAHEHSTVLTMLNPGIWQSRIFVPLLGVRIAKFAQSNANLTVKIDDVDFNATNEGIWCLHFRELMDSNRFTDWNEYSTDTVIGESNDLPATQQVLIRDVTKAAMTEIVNDVVEEVTNEVFNQTELGLDTETPAPTEMPAVVSEIVNSADTAANAYAEGVTADPIAEQSVNKPVKAKK